MTMSWRKSVLLCLALAAVAACASVPTGPTVSVLPGPGKPFEQFQADDAVCRQWAQQSAGASPGETANQSTISGAAIGTLLGAGLGAGIGAATGNVGAGAAVGAGAGLIGGTAVGSSQGQAAGMSLQRRYNIAYEQCMYAKGNQVPGAAAPVPAYPGTPAPPYGR